MAERAHVEDRLLRGAAILYAVGTIIHTADHFRRGTDTLTTHVVSIGSAATVAAFVVIGLVLAGHRTAPLLAAGFGLAHGVGIAAVHLLPQWGVFSDAFTGSSVAPGVSGLSWFAVLLEVAGALATGIAGVAVLRGHGRLERRRRSRGSPGPARRYDTQGCGTRRSTSSRDGRASSSTDTRRRAPS